MYGPLSAIALLLPLMAEPSLGQPIDPQHIVGGDYVDSCGWPSVVYLSGNGGACTGTLIHPRIVLTAAHCITQDTPTNVRFGENGQTATQLTETVTCRQGPGWTGATAQGEDYGYCLLEAPVTTVPIIPVVNACEASAIYQGARIMHVGFGHDGNGESGRKKMLELTINNITGAGEILSGNANEVICNGDSGGPTFVYLDPAEGGDGTWRVAAIHSWAYGADAENPDCSGGAGSVMVTNAISWIEEDSGIDITPCADGNQWAPTAHCGNFPVAPWNGGGSYPNCSAPDVVEWGSTCGPSLAATPDDTAPVVNVLTPSTGDEFDPDGTASVDVAVEASDDGWGVAEVSMTIRDVATGDEQVDVRNEWQSLSWGLTLPAGSYEVVLVATDHAGNASEEEVVCFGVGEPGCGLEGGSEGGGDESTGGDPSGGTGDGEDSDGAAGTSGDAGEDSDADDDDDDDGDDGDTDSGAAADGGSGGGGCRVGGTGGGFGLLLLGLLVPFRRRR